MTEPEAGADLPSGDPAATAEPVGEVAAALRRRRRLEVSRGRLTVRLSAEELSEVGVAASRRGLTRSGFVASAALAAARGLGAPVAGEEQLPGAVRDATRALDDVGVNLNQAVRRFHTTGQPPPELEAAAAAVAAATAVVESTMAALLRRLV